MKLLAIAAAAVALAAPGASVDYLAGHQQADGGFAEAGGRSTPGLTAWTVLALAAAGRQPSRPDAVVAYLNGQETPAATDLELRLLALDALGAPVEGLADRIQALRRPDGRIGTLVNSTAWGVIALRAADRPAGPATVHWLLARQAASGGWSWVPDGAPDADDTGRAPGGAPLAYLAGLRRPDGSYRYSARYGTTPLWVTSYVVPALARKPFPLP